MDLHDNAQRDLNNPLFWVRTTQWDGGNYYGWVSIDTTATRVGGQPQLLVQAAPLYGYVSPKVISPFYEINGNQIPIGTYVQIRRSHFDPLYDWVYVTDHCCSGNPNSSLIVVTDVEVTCIDGIIYVAQTKKKIIGDFFVVDP